MEQKKSVFEVLNAIDCSEHIEKKNGLNYLSWAWAWSITKKNFPNAQYKIYERGETGIPYFTDGKTAWVKTGVTIEGQEHIEYLPIMDYKNNSIPLDRITSMDMNKAIQRSLTKAIGRHGLGLYVYAGEDLNPEASQVTEPQRTFNPEPMATPPLEAQNVDNLFGPQPEDTIMDDLYTRLNNCKDLNTLTDIWNDCKVLLAQRPKDFKTIKKQVAILGEELKKK